MIQEYFDFLKKIASTFALTKDFRLVREVSSINSGFISAELSFKLRLPVDAHSFNEAFLTFAYEVTKGTVIISHDEPARLEFLENTWINYFDFEPLMEESLCDLLRV